MPVYEYFCSKCKAKFELLRPISEAQNKASCPTCGNKSERIPSTFSAHSTGDFGESVPVGGSSCAGCSADSCASCGL